MDAQDFRSLQEAYLEVVEGREGGRFEYNQRHGRPLITPEISQRASSQETLGGGTYERGPKRLPKSKRKYDRQVLSGVRAASEQEKQRARKRMGIKEDIYDIILSHLLDEGYADTEQAAEAIMVNMSEEWRESIVEEMLDEGAAQNVADRAQKLANQRKGQTPKRKATYQSLANKADERANPKPEADWRTGISDSTRKMNVSTYADQDKVKIKTTNPKKLRKQKAMGEH
jgi:hypothetical protein